MTSTVAWSDLAFFYFIAIIPLSLLWSMGLKDLSRDLAISIVRMSIQLLVIGFYLQTVFDLDNLALNILWLVAMALIAAITSAGRAEMPRLKSAIPLTSAILIAMLPVLLMFIVVLSRTQAAHEKRESVSR
ncbi:ABC transporter permease (plasmid) [Microbulbifer sp. SSSA002]|uniref:ABC transporter permease n=1 Tax=Microbulbifer sp. SSSA002 TaxID=3243376 RepID=UPI00403A0591